MVRDMNHFASANYWEQRYRAGGTSGAGSRGALAEWKATFINTFIRDNAIADVLEFGCGDGHVLSLLRVPAYTGTDASPSALAQCARRFPQHRFLALPDVAPTLSADLVLSIDVIFHLTEDTVFMQHLHDVFSHARRFVVIHSSNFESDWPAPHVRHRRFTDRVAALWRDWRLMAHVPARHPYDPSRPDQTSFADFFVFGHSGEFCRVFAS